ncbi:hypothetical protein O3S81_25230 [Agrobacterium sp. SOY23]|uniref:hypothetical protein n=1 Tax=Agrobacterium sp. SOY23 TaxID=3014555 RepID=UPI0022B05C90|nr:hypothetical protein [Agrobacterium sp. SOY23]MCZ4433014.1 hypothetical protein [Agrobacterium sp. SOY23]
MNRICALFLTLAVSVSAARADVHVLVATLPDGGYWAKAASVAINMQIFRTLRKQGDRGEVFPDAEIIVNPPTTPVTDDASAERAARLAENTASIAVWGNIYEFPGEVVISPVITVLPNRYFREDSELFEQWRIGVGTNQLSLGLPRSSYSLKLIRVPNQFIDAYSQPNSLPIYERATTESRRLGAVEQYPIKALEVHENWIKIRRQSPDPIEGWLATPDLGRGDDELVNFVGGLIRTFRGDWRGADQLFTQVKRSDGGTAAVKADASLLQLRMRAQQGADTSELAGAVTRDLPNSITALQYVYMASLSECSRAPSNRCAEVNKDLVARLQSKIELLPPGDPWLAATVRQMDQQK